MKIVNRTSAHAIINKYKKNVKTKYKYKKDVYMVSSCALNFHSCIRALLDEHGKGMYMCMFVTIKEDGDTVRAVSRTRL